MARVLAERVIGLEDSFPQNHYDFIKALWDDSGVQAAIAKGNEYALHDNLA